MTMTTDALTVHVIREYGGQATVTVEQAAQIVGIGREHAYRLASQHRFPVLGVTAAGAHRESIAYSSPRWSTGCSPAAPVSTTTFANTSTRRGEREPRAGDIDHRTKRRGEFSQGTFRGLPRRSVPVRVGDSILVKAIE
jgi:hypothetical protein